MKESGAENQLAGRFVDAIIAPMEYELTKRFYGWRVNDIIKPTDNVKTSNWECWRLQEEP